MEKKRQRDFLTNFYDTFHFMTSGPWLISKLIFSLCIYLLRQLFDLDVHKDFYRLQGGREGGRCCHKNVSAPLLKTINVKKCLLASQLDTVA